MLTDLKKEVWELHDKIEELKLKRDWFGLSNQEDLELRNLEAQFYSKWSELKDG